MALIVKTMNLETTTIRAPYPHHIEPMHNVVSKALAIIAALNVLALSLIWAGNPELSPNAAWIVFIGLPLALAAYTYRE